MGWSCSWIAVKVWSAVYDELEDPDHLTASGRLPPSYRLPESGDDEGEGVDDLFNVPLELGAELTDFRYDDAGGLKPLVSASGIQRKRWWLLGG